jgi:hypothetical protein
MAFPATPPAYLDISLDRETTPVSHWCAISEEPEKYALNTYSMLNFIFAICVW